jgi:nitroreductase
MPTTHNESAVALLLERRSVSPKRLGSPGPNSEEVNLILRAALRAPDHGRLHPWRFIEFSAAQRNQLANCFEREKLRRDPLASERDRRSNREHATRPPVLLAFVVSPHLPSKVPVREQWLAAGAALGNALNAIHQLGFGAMMLSGERCFDSLLAAELGLKVDEFLAGFISVGRVTDPPPSKRSVSTVEIWSDWKPLADLQPPAGPEQSGTIR